MLSRYCSLAQEGVLGLNRRNGDYILKFNPRRLFPLVDDKLQTKQLALKAGIAVPDLYGVSRNAARHSSPCPRSLRPISEFALKPAHGSAGDGIVVISGRSGSRYRTISGSLLDSDDLACITCRTRSTTSSAWAACPTS